METIEMVEFVQWCWSVVTCHGNDKTYLVVMNQLLHEAYEYEQEEMELLSPEY